MLPDLKRLGPRLGKQLPELKKALAAADAGGAAGAAGSRQAGDARLARRTGRARRATTCKSACKPSPAGPRRKGAACVVVLSTELDAELLAEGLARELVHAIQTRARTWAASTPTASKSAW